MVKNTGAALFNLLLFIIAVAAALFAVRFAWIEFYKSAYPMGYSGLVLEQSANTGVPPELLFAVIRTESGFNPNAQSHVPARGLMQITEDTFNWAQYRIKEEQSLHFDDLFQSEINVRYGAEILRLLLDEFGSENNALCAYHAGWGDTKRWLENPEYASGGEVVKIPYGNTRRYVAKVLATKEIYKKLYFQAS